MAQQTAVEYLINYMLENFHLTDYTVMVVFEQAKQMEKEQMIDLIRFLRIQDKMGKSVEDLYEQFKNK